MLTGGGLKDQLLFMVDHKRHRINQSSEANKQTGRKELAILLRFLHCSAKPHKLSIQIVMNAASVFRINVARMRRSDSPLRVTCDLAVIFVGTLVALSNLLI